MLAKRNLAREDRLRRSVEHDLLWRQRTALAYGKKVQTDDAIGDVPWSERTRRDAYNLKMIEIAAAGVRAKQMADAGPKMLGVVAVVNRIDDHAKWEEMAKAIEAGKQVIDVEAIAHDPVREEDVHGTRGAIGGVQEQLGESVPQGQAQEAQKDEGKEPVGGG